MPVIRASELRNRDRHHLMVHSIVPRPIAWVTTRSEQGVVNLAPFSFFNGVSATPPLLSISVSNRRRADGTFFPKDTLRNIESGRAFVVHVVDEAHAHHMVETAGPFAPDESEVDAVGLKTVDSEAVDVPRLADAAVAMECTLFDVVRPAGAEVGLVLGQIDRWHLRDDLVDADGRPAIDVHKLMPVARLGGDRYCPVRDVFQMEAPRPARG